MSKYNVLWEYLKKNGEEEYILSFQELKDILGFDIDHSFLRYKIEAKDYGYVVLKISMKEKKVSFARL